MAKRGMEAVLFNSARINSIRKPCVTLMQVYRIVNLKLLEDLDPCNIGSVTLVEGLWRCMNYRFCYRPKGDIGLVRQYCI